MITFTATVRRAGGRDSWGDDKPSAMHTIEGCVRWPRDSSESTDRSDVVLAGWTIVVPPGSDILATDEVQMPDVDGWWQVEGDPAAASSPYASPLTGWNPGVPVALTRTRG